VHVGEKLAVSSGVNSSDLLRALNICVLDKLVKYFISKESETL